MHVILRSQVSVQNMPKEYSKKSFSAGRKVVDIEEKPKA
jgi:hypothetical protein